MKYLAKRAVIRPILGYFDHTRRYTRAVVIPALAEAEYLPSTLHSIASNIPERLFNETLVLIVVNNASPESSDAVHRDKLIEYAKNNALTLSWLERNGQTFPFSLSWIDASTPGKELPPGSGVGLARKIGCDSVIHFLRSTWGEDPLDAIIYSLDADTLVSPHYLEWTGNELMEKRCGGGIISFKHQPAETPEGQEVIDAYEKYLHYYVGGLRWAGSPYAFHTIGSCLCFTVDSYVRANGFPTRRMAGEDFYFINELVKTSRVCEIKNTLVFPSARLSQRVPFGTGKRMADALLKGEKDLLFYDPRVFRCLRDLLTTISELSDKTATRIMAQCEHTATALFLERRGFPIVWERFQRQYHTKSALLKAFHRWFDGFVTLKYIHWLTETVWPRIPIHDVPDTCFASEPHIP